MVKPDISGKNQAALPSPAAIHIELRRKGVTLRLLHEEYFLGDPNGYGYTKFVEL